MFKHDKQSFRFKDPFVLLVDNQVIMGRPPLAETSVLFTVTTMPR